MSILQRKAKWKESSVKTYQDFWNWFQQEEKRFHDVIKSRKDIERHFFNFLAPKLKALNKGFVYLAGMYDSDTAELIITADGVVKNIVFVEELIASAPTLPGWRFTALKPALEIEGLTIEMDGLTFNEENMSFYVNEIQNYPDEIDITIVHKAWTPEKSKPITVGVHIFLDNFLGELDFAEDIDNIQVGGSYPPSKGLIPLSKLKDFLVWRKKEFIEKYIGVGYNTESNTHSAMGAQVENGNELLMIFNSELLNWDAKASHPWISVLTVKYDGRKSKGKPCDADQSVLFAIGNKLEANCDGINGCFVLGHQSGNGECRFFLASTDFRFPSKVLSGICKESHSGLKLDYEIYKDKYWRSMEQFK